MEKQCLPFFPEPFTRLSGLRQCCTERHRFRCGSQRESCSQLHAAQYTYGIFTKAIRSVAQHMGVEVSSTVEGIAEL